MNTKQFFGCFYCVGVFGGGLFLGECTGLPQGRKGPGGSGQKCSLEHIVAMDVRRLEVVLLFFSPAGAKAGAGF